MRRVVRDSYELWEKVIDPLSQSVSCLGQFCEYMCVFMSKNLVSDMFFLLSQACAIMQSSRWRGTELCGSARSEIFVHKSLKTCFYPVYIDHICRVIYLRAILSVTPSITMPTNTLRYVPVPTDENTFV